MEYPKEFTYKEYRDFIEKNNFESFSNEQVQAFSRDVLAKSKVEEIDFFEQACAAADFASLNRVVVIREDLSKSICYWREAQTEEVEIPDGIFKSKDDRMCRRFKITPLNILKGIAGINCADTEAIEKARIADPIGAVRIWNGKEYTKTPQGWRPKENKTTSAEVNAKEGKKKGIEALKKERAELSRKMEDAKKTGNEADYKKARAAYEEVSKRISSFS